MSFCNSPSSFGEGELTFKNVPEECLDPYKCVQYFRKKLEESLVSKKEFYKSLLSDTDPKLQAIEEKIAIMSEEIQQMKDDNNSLSAKLMSTKLALNELELKKKALEEKENRSHNISQEELSEILQKVVSTEAAHELQIQEMKKNAKILVGKMCFYKEYLDVYVDMPQEDDFILYFRRCQGNDLSRPKEWIRITTGDFKEYILTDTSLPEGSKERNELITRCNNGINLRKLVILARKYCLSQ